MKGLAPSILSFDMTTLHEAIPTMVAAGASIVHYDVMDGQFVPPITFGDHLVRDLNRRVESFAEVHLMTVTPERHFEAFAAAGARRILFHVEATSHGYRLAEQLRAMGVSPGVAINPGTPVEVVLPILDVVDEVLCMTVNPGWGGQTFIPSALLKVARLRSERPDLLIEVDGGIDPNTLPYARDAGADVFVVGSYLAKSPDLAAATRALVEMC